MDKKFVQVYRSNLQGHLDTMQANYTSNALGFNKLDIDDPVN